MMAIIVRGGQQNANFAATATELRPQLREERQARLSGGSSSYDAACNPVSLKVSEFARVIGVDFTERKLVEVETVKAPADGFDW